ncbi:hypothetical protein G6N82_09180 [Altererythrobacter sp. BO-6]|uniref:hypothetical protein n=1 Tax=Altererythrobacter sp. BO-6 TaxID=2604537 RepID=UPI0013E142F2|nr:hypothetical protein [Altererythrobacter sp. BO-6]QIG54295.1 hypothetical protein G6N82_09180 [Altererythrobacter sp. BO-6]
MGRLIPLVVALAACAINSPASAETGTDNAVILKPSSPWHVDYADQKCTLAREFDVGNAKHILLFSQVGPTPRFGLIAAGSSFKGFTPSRGIQHRFGNIVEKDRAPLLGDYSGFGPALVYSATTLEAAKDAIAKSASQARSMEANRTDTLPLRFPSIDIDLALQVDGVTFSQGKQVVLFQTGNLAKPFEALNKCIEDLAASKGIDIDKHREFSREVRWTNIFEIAQRLQRSYVRGPSRGRESGIFGVFVIVDEAGGLAECHIEGLTVAESLTSPACKEMKRAKFEPALDINGVPMKSFLTTTMSYRASP